ncbi:MAG: aldo/keto reductase [Spirochaetales bacterium]
MQNYRLGQSDIFVSRVGLGCWQFSQGRGMVGGYWDALPAERVREIVATSLENGVNWFDTAEIYGRGASEQALADALTETKTPRDAFAIADKWWPALRFAGSISRTFPRREQALGGMRVDLHQIHQPFSLSSIERQASEMASLVTTGRVRAVGVSNFNERRMRAAHAVMKRAGVALATNQVKYSLIDREIERNGILDAAKELGVSVIAYSPLAQGVLTGKYHGQADIRETAGPRKHMKRFKPKGLEATRALVGELEKVATVHNVRPSQIALAWIVQRHGQQIVTIPGASSVGQARANAESMRVSLSEEELETLDSRGLEAESRLARI